MKRNLAWLAALFGVLVVLVVILRDYLTPAELQVDLNAPRFRLIRHRIIFSDSQLEMEWRPMSNWNETAVESVPIFGERRSGVVYAWEMEGTIMSRFEKLYSFDRSGEDPNNPRERAWASALGITTNEPQSSGASGEWSDEWIRTNYGCYSGTVGVLLIEERRRVKSREQWLARYRHQKTLDVSQEEIDADEAARDADEAYRKAVSGPRTRDGAPSK